MGTFASYVATLWPGQKPGKDQCGCGCGVILLILLLTLGQWLIFRRRVQYTT